MLVAWSIATAQSAPWAKCSSGKDVDTGTAFGSPHLAGYSGNLTPELLQAGGFIALTSPEQRPAVDAILTARLQASNPRFDRTAWLALRNLAIRGVDDHAGTRGLLYGLITGPLGGAYSQTMVPGILKRNETSDPFARGAVEVVTEECLLRPIIDRLIKSPCEMTAGRALYLAARANRDAPRSCAPPPIQEPTLRMTKLQMAPDGLKVSIAPGSAKPGMRTHFRVVRATSATLGASAAQVWSGEAVIESEPGATASLYAVVARGITLAPDRSRPFLLVDTTSARSQEAVACEQPLPEKWEPRHRMPMPNGLHGPYDTVVNAMTRDSASSIALQLTGSGWSEYGFVILRDLRQARGGYYTTPPVRSSREPSAYEKPLLNWEDYVTSFERAFSSSCEPDDKFTLAAAVHTHPDRGYPSDSFSASDFNQAIELKWKYPAFEMIIMINADDRKVRTFAPKAVDAQFTDAEIYLADTVPHLVPLWKDYVNNRVRIMGAFPR